MRNTTIAALAVAGLALAACGTSQAAGQPNITVHTDTSDPGISVSGVGEVKGTPDTVNLDLGVAVLAGTVSEASSTAADKAQALINSLTGNGVAEADITTTNYSIWPEYRWDDNTQTLVGYRVMNTVRVKIRDVAGTGNLIDEAVAAGGDDVMVNGLSFSIEDDADMITAAREAAWQNALAKAKQLADLSGQPLGAVISISETVTGHEPPIFYGRDAALAAEETSIQPGTSTVKINLAVKFALGA